MRGAHAWRRFLSASGRRRWLAVEAGAELARARLVTLLPARFYTREFGRLGAEPGAEGSAGATVRAAEVGRMVEAVAASMPFRALCLQQAIATCRMLRRRRLRPVVYLGVNRDPAKRAAPRTGAAAHAWVEVGAEVVNGGGEHADFAIVGRFC